MPPIFFYQPDLSSPHRYQIILKALYHDLASMDSDFIIKKIISRWNKVPPKPVSFSKQFYSFNCNVVCSVGGDNLNLEF